jgi:hypothetical protein
MKDKRHSNRDHGRKDHYNRHVDGDISVRWQLEVHPPPDIAVGLLVVALGIIGLWSQNNDRDENHPDQPAKPCVVAK